MKRTAIVVAPGRGSYNRGELGWLARHHAGRAGLLAPFEALRADLGQESLRALDGAARFDPARHLRGDNAAALIMAAAWLDFLAIDRARYDIVGITGNSMGWYIAATCAGALAPVAGFEVVNTMGRLMHEHMIGGQVIYPVADDDWRPQPQRRAQVLEAVAAIDARPGHVLALSIDLGGMLVLAGNEAGLAAFAAAVPRLEGRYPLRLPGHAAFHTHLQEPVARAGRAALGPELFGTPDLPLIDGRGAIWWPGAVDAGRLRAYTLGDQVVTPYDFTAAIRVAAREFMPDVFIVLGPGTTLRGAVGAALVAAGWRGVQDKAGLRVPEGDAPRLIAMGDEAARRLVVGGQ